MASAGRRSFALLLVAGSLIGCGSDRATGSTSAEDPDAGLPAIIETPPLACAGESASCVCSPSDAGDGVLDAALDLCGQNVAPDASCCAGPDYPFAGECTCSASACSEGGIPIPSCSRPPTFIDAGVCDPSECSGTSCAGGYCCTSSCQSGACQSTCS